MPPSLLDRLHRSLRTPGDQGPSGGGEQQRLAQRILPKASIGIALLAVLWGLIYIQLGYPVSGAIPLGYAAVSLASLAYFIATRHFVLFRTIQLTLILLAPFLLQWSLGGFVNGSAVMIWAFFTPLAAVFFGDARHALRWLPPVIALILVSGLLDSTLSQHARPMPRAANTAFFVLNTTGALLAIFLLLNRFVKDRERAYRQNVTTKEQAIAARKELEFANRQLKEDEIRIRELMLTDPLTGIANRRHLDERLEQEVRRAHRYGIGFSIVMTDIDHFKDINDSHGHDAGDRVLRAFAAVLERSIRDTDFAARYGGEEFILLLPETDSGAAMDMAERIRRAVEGMRVASVDHRITASFGVAAGDGGADLEDMLRNADRALYRSKDAGRNRVTLGATSGTDAVQSAGGSA